MARDVSAPDDPPVSENPRGAEDPATGATSRLGDAPAPPPDDRRGEGVIRLSWAGTAAYAVAVVVATTVPEGGQLPLVIVCVVLFLAGMVAFLAAYVVAIGRSRHVAIGIGGLYFLAGTAPPRVRRHLLGSFAVELAVAVVSASIGLARSAADADNPLAFGVLTPLFGLGLAGLWGARHGAFAPRPPPPVRGAGGGRPGSARAERPVGAGPVTGAGVAGEREGAG
jgi:hypothetical protein